MTDSHRILQGTRTWAVIFLTAQSLFAWNSPLYPTNWRPPVDSSFYTDMLIQDFSYAGYHRGEKALPTVSTNVIDVTKAPYNADKTGSTDATSAIQSAINQVVSSGSGVVYLPAGTYRVNPGNNNYSLRITGSNVVLRGEGVGKTFILNTSYQMRNKSVISVNPFTGSTWTSPPSTNAKITSDLMGPVTIIPVDNPSLFKAGDWVLLRSDITEGWITEHKENEWSGASFPGFIYYRQVESVNTSAKTITIDAPIRYAMKTRDNARVHLSPAMIEEVGLENFSIGNVQHPGTTGWGEEDYNTAGNASYDCHASFLVSISRVRNGWVRKVESYGHSANSSGAHMLSNGLALSYTRGITVDSCHFQYDQYGGGGGNGYMYRIQGNENLLKNCKSSFSRHGFVLSHMYGSGNVFFRCIDKNSGVQTGATGSMTTSGKGSDHHMHFSPSNLFDQCTSDNSNFQAAYRPYGSTPKHNLTAAHSVYWNTQGLGSGPTSWVIHSQQARYGYVIGTWGTRTSVNTSSTTTSAPKTDPADHVEGIGLAQTLEPQSLYLDQLKKRTTVVSFTLTTSIIGQGSVTRSPNGTGYASGTVVTLTATPAAGYVFSGWSGELNGQANPATVTLNANLVVSAFFTKQTPAGSEKIPIVSDQAAAEQEGNPAVNSYDDNITTRWANDNTLSNAWIIYDLEKAHTVKAIRLMLNNAATRTYQLKIEVGDGSMTEVWSGTTELNVGLQTIIVTPANGRYVKLTMTASNSGSNNWFSIFETEVWGNVTPSTAASAELTAGVRTWEITQRLGNLDIRAPRNQTVDVVLYDVRGRAVNTFFSGKIAAGVHIFKTSHVPSGTFLVLLRDENGNTILKKCLSITQ